MVERIGWQNGNWLPLEQIHLPIEDLGCIQGVMVVDRMRTYHGQLLDQEAHLLRWQTACRQLGIDVAPPRSTLDGHVLEQLVQRNHRGPLDDFGIVLLATPGPGRGERATVIAHPTPIAWSTLHSWYERGQQLSLAEQHVVPDVCWPIGVKNRARINYFLADRAARVKLQDSNAAGLLVTTYHSIDDAANPGRPMTCIADTSAANVLILERTLAGLRMVSPPDEHCFSGLSLRRTARLAQDLGIPLTYEPISPRRASQAAGLFLTGTTGCIWRARCLDERSWFDSSSEAGRSESDADDVCRLYEQLCTAWQAEVGIDFRKQASERAV
jgi:branched-chain amino acid aminotransferase